MLNISVEGLFGHFNYEIVLKENRINILTGPNGFGKSTIIKCIDAMSKSNIRYFMNLCFKKIEITHCQSNKSIVLQKSENGILINEVFYSELFIVRMSRGVNLKAADDSKQNKDIIKKQESFKEIIRQMSVMFGNVKLIGEQRLIKDSTERMPRTLGISREVKNEDIEKVAMIPYKFEEIVADIEGQYSRVSNELDSTFPERLFDQQEGITEEEFLEKLNDMQTKVKKLNRYGISGVREPGNIRFKVEDARALKVYFEDFQRKYEIYSDFLERLELFNNIVNSRFKFKKVETLVNGKFLVREIDNKREIDLTKLSSGEKEILILFFMLLFEVEKNTLLLIDEPELSLHIAWQRMFVRDLKKIVKLQNLTVVIATHSPQMISGNQELQIDLGELYKNGLNKRK